MVWLSDGIQNGSLRCNYYIIDEQDVLSVQMEYKTEICVVTPCKSYCAI